MTQARTGIARVDNRKTTPNTQLSALYFEQAQNNPNTTLAVEAGSLLHPVDPAAKPSCLENEVRARYRLLLRHKQLPPLSQQLQK